MSSSAVPASRRLLSTLLAVAMATALLVVVPPPPASATTIVVNTAQDIDYNASTDRFPDDGLCSLRAAMMSAQNNSNGHDSDCATGLGAGTMDIINIHPSLAGQTLTLTYATTDGVQQLPAMYGGATNPVQIIGPTTNAADFVIDGGNQTRLFEFGFLASGSDANRGVVTMANLTVRGGNGVHNSAAPWTIAGDGGAMYLHYKTELTLDNVVLRDNQVTAGNARGGAIYAIQPTITNNGGAYVANRATGSAANRGYGGAVFLTTEDAPATLNGYAVLFDGNQASHAGGAVALFPGTAPPVLNLERSLAKNNSAPNGGVAYVDAGSTTATPGTVFTLTDTTATGNSSTTGGGVFFANHSRYAFSFLRSTFVGNTGPGGLFWAATGTIRNSIIQDSPCQVASGGSRAIGTRNLFGGTNTGCNTTELDSVGTITGLSPTLAQNGGPEVQQTFRLAQGSNAIDNGSPTYCGTIDARSVPRGVDGDGTVDSPQTGDCDIGAYEYAPYVVNFVTGTSTVVEGATANVQVKLSIPDPGDRPLAADLVIPITRLQSSTARSDIDYTVPAAGLTIPAGTPHGGTVSYTVATLQDDIAERHGEEIDLELGSAAGVATAEPVLHNLVIQDDDQAGVIVSDGGDGSSITEVDTTATDTFTVSLRSRPDYSQPDPNDSNSYGDPADVVMSVEPDRDCTATVAGQTASLGDPKTVTILNADWQSGHAVEVSAVQDLYDEDFRDESATHPCTITFTFDSDDPVYDATTDRYDVDTTDNDENGVTLDIGGGVDVEEGGATDSYTIVLRTPPDPGDPPPSPARGPTFVVADPDEQCNLGGGRGTPVALPFTEATWSTPQTVTVTAYDDPTVELGHTCAISHTITSDDPFYADIDDLPSWTRTPAGVTVQIEDYEPPTNENDPPQVDITTTSGVDVVEGGVGDTLSVVLHRQPLNANVLVTLTSSVDPRIPGSQVGMRMTGSGAGHVGDLTLTFTPANWDVPQSVDVAAVDDDYDESATQTPPTPDTHTAAIAATMSSTAVGFNDDSLRKFNVDGSEQIDVGDVLVTVTDNDTSAIVVTEPGGSTEVTEGGSGDSFDIELATHPYDDVTVTVTPDDQCDIGAGAGVAVPFAFAAADWATAQTVTVDAVDDDLVEGPHTCVVTSTSTSAGDHLYVGLDGGPGEVAITDDDLPLVEIDTGAGIVLDEADDTIAGTYTVVLGNQPDDAVDVVVSAADGQTLVSAGGDPSSDETTVTFTTTDWDVPQEVTVTVVDDDVDEPDPHDAAIVHVVDSLATGFATAPLYTVDGVPSATVVPSIADDDTAGVTLVESDGATAVSEAGDEDTYTVVLTSEPTDDVTLMPTGDAQCDVSTPHTFTALNWATPATVTVTAVDDDTVEGPHTCVVSHTLTSLDGLYDGLAVADVTIDVADDDVAGVAITAGDLELREGDATSVSYEVVLTAGPVSDVKVDISADTQVSLPGGPVHTLTFTPTDWATPQSVTVDVVDDAVREGAHEGVLTHTVSSLAVGFDAGVAMSVDGVVGDAVTVAIVDDDVPDLGVDVVDGPTVFPGDALAFAVTAGNSAVVSGESVALSATVPVGTTFDAAASTPGWSCPDGAPAGTACGLPLGTVAASDTPAAVFGLLVDPTVPSGLDAVEVTVSIAETGPDAADGDPTNDVDTATAVLDAAPDLVVTSAPRSSVHRGNVLSYRLTVTNAGDQDATGVLVTQAVPDHTVSDEGSSTAGWSCPDGSAPTTICSFVVGPLAAGASSTVVLAVVVDPATPLGTDIVAVATGADDGTNGLDRDVADNEVSTTTTVVAVPPDPPEEDDGTGTFVVPPGGTTPNGGVSPSSDAPVVAIVTSPTGGTVEIVRVAPEDEDVTGFEILGYSLHIDGPPAPSADDPITIEFRMDASLLEGVDPAAVLVLHDGEPVGGCRAPGAVPDPCVLSTTSADGVVRIVVLTTTLSPWTLALPMFQACPVDANGPFTDVADASVHGSTIACLADRGIVSGTTATTFEPAAGATRGQVAAMLMRLLRDAGRVAPDLEPDAFADTVGSTHAADISELVELGVITGYADGTFRPGRLVTRAQVATMVAATHELVSGVDLPTVGSSYADVPATHAHASGISALTAAGIAEGTDGTHFLPDGPVSRAQLASLLARTIGSLADGFA